MGQTILGVTLQCSEVSDVIFEGRRVDQMCVRRVDELAVRVHQSLGPGERLVHLDSQVSAMILWLPELALVVVAVFIVDFHE